MIRIYYINSIISPGLKSDILGGNFPLQRVATSRFNACLRTFVPYYNNTNQIYMQEKNFLFAIFYVLKKECRNLSHNFVQLTQISSNLMYIHRGLLTVRPVFYFAKRHIMSLHLWGRWHCVAMTEGGKTRSRTILIVMVQKDPSASLRMTKTER